MNSLYTATGDPIADKSASFLEQLRKYWESIERKTEERPSFYLLISFLIGYALQVLPLRALLGVILRLLVVLIKPALLVLGLWKLSQSFKASRT